MASFKDIFKSAYPFISTALGLGGPVGAMAASALGKAIGVDNATPETIDDQVTAAAAKDPDVLLKVKQAEDDFGVKMAQLGYDSAEKLQELAAGDRASARAREVAVKDKTPRNLAYLVVALTLLGEGWAFVHGVTGIDPMVVGRVLGTLDSALMLVLAYYFGSSAGSADKNALLAASQPPKSN